MPMTGTADDIRWMQYALELAEMAMVRGEVPVGAVLVRDNTELGRGYNQPIMTNDPTAHAEIVALRDAARAAENYRLPGSTLYVTIEPCTMCVGAMIHARVQRLVFGAKEPRAGAVCSGHRLLDSDTYNHRIEFVAGVLEEECSKLIRDFFRSRR
jgi:tRNA(adenine34) deaminase